MAVMTCTCENGYQDKKYGTQKRVHNETEKKSGTKPIYRCSVCSSEKT